MAFAYAQLIYSFLLATGYLLVVLYTHRSICLKFQGSGNSFTNSRSSHGVQLSLWPQRWSLFNKNVSKYVYLEPASTSMAWTFTKQSWLKHCLTEGDKALLWWLTVPADQGAYAFANNLGKFLVFLKARIDFKIKTKYPLSQEVLWQESSFNQWRRVCVPISQREWRLLRTLVVITLIFIFLVLFKHLSVSTSCSLMYFFLLRQLTLIFLFIFLVDLNGLHRLPLPPCCPPIVCMYR